MNRTLLAILLFIEILLLGGISSFIGLVISVILLLFFQNQVVIAISFLKFNQESLAATMLFLVITYILIGAFYAFRVYFLPIRKMIGIQNENNERTKNINFIPKAFFSIILLIFGYLGIHYILYLKFLGIFLAAICISMGTYLFYNSILPLIFKILLKSRKFAFKGIRRFTIAQLNTRLRILSKFLGTMTLLIYISISLIE